MAKVASWGYSEEINLHSKEDRMSIRFIAHCSISTFLRTVDDGGRGCSGWVRPRMSETGNQLQLELLEQYPSLMLMVRSIFNSHTKYGCPIESLEILGATELKLSPEPPHSHK